MAQYEFRCQACGFEFEKLRKMEERDLTSCPQCGARATAKISVVNYSVGWRLDEQSHLPGHKDNLERDT